MLLHMPFSFPLPTQMMLCGVDRYVYPLTTISKSLEAKYFQVFVEVWLCHLHASHSGGTAAAAAAAADKLALLGPTKLRTYI